MTQPADPQPDVTEARQNARERLAALDGVWTEDRWVQAREEQDARVAEAMSRTA